MLSRDRIRTLYDRQGLGIERWRYCMQPGLDALEVHGLFNSAQAVFEFGCGTGRFADKLLSLRMPVTAAYTAVDLAPRMVALTRQRLERFGARASVRQSEGAMRVEAADGAFDRFLCTYVLELLPRHEIAELLGEAHRVLADDGLLCIACLSAGDTRAHQIVGAVCRAMVAVRPAFLGGCQPIELSGLIDDVLWSIDYADLASKLGVASQVLVAKKITPAGAAHAA